MELNAFWQLGLDKDGSAGVPAAICETKAYGTDRAMRWKKGINDFTRGERSEGILDVKVGAKFAPVYQEPTWKENGEKMAGLVFKLEGHLRCALTGKFASDDLSHCGERSGPKIDVESAHKMLILKCTSHALESQTKFGCQIVHSSSASGQPTSNSKGCGRACLGECNSSRREQ